MYTNYYEYLDVNNKWQPYGMETEHEMEGEAFDQAITTSKVILEDKKCRAVRGWVYNDKDVGYNEVPFYYGELWADKLIEETDKTKLK